MSAEGVYEMPRVVFVEHGGVDTTVGPEPVRKKL